MLLRANPVLVLSRSTWYFSNGRVRKIKCQTLQSLGKSQHPFTGMSSPEATHCPKPDINESHKRDTCTHLSLPIRRTSWNRWTPPEKKNQGKTLTELHRHQWPSPRMALRTDNNLVTKQEKMKQCQAYRTAGLFPLSSCLLQIILSLEMRPLLPRQNVTWPADMLWPQWRPVVAGTQVPPWVTHK